MQQISLAERATHLAPTGARAEAAVGSVHHREFGDCLVVLRQPGTDRVELPVALPEEDDRPQDAAIGAVCRGTHKTNLRWTVKPGVQVGEWVTESGVTVQGYAVRLSDLFGQMPAEETVFLPWRELAAAELSEEFHTVAPEDHRWGAEAVQVESPTLRVLDPATGHEVVLCGLTGALVSRWRHRVMPGG